MIAQGYVIFEFQQNEGGAAVSCTTAIDSLYCCVEQLVGSLSVGGAISLNRYDTLCKHSSACNVAKETGKSGRKKGRKLLAQWQLATSDPG